MRWTTFVVLLLLLVPVANGAGTWEELFRALIDQSTGDELIQSGKLYQGTLYSANIQFIITDGDGNTNNFASGDTISIRINGDRLQFQGNKDGLTTWAEDNGRAIYDAIFPTDVGGEVTGSTDSQQAQEAFFPSIIFKAVDASKTNTNDFIARAEFAFATVGPKDNDTFTFTGVPSYSFHFGDDMRNALGAYAPVRYAKQDDAMRSELISLSLCPFVRYNLFERDSFLVPEDRFVLDAGITLLTHATFVSSVVLRGGVGSFRFGSTLYTAAQWTPSDYLTVRAGLSYQVSKVYIPNNVVKSDLQWIVDTINELPVDHEIGFGVNLQVPVSDDFSVSLDYFRIHSVSSRANSDNYAVSTIAVMFNYLLADIADISLGYKTRLEVPNLSEHSLLVGGLVRF